jgi:glycosyltransferase involved in cell wall biosynthesis
MSKKLKILWFSNYRFSNEPIKTTGTWLKVIGEALIKEKDIELINVTMGATKEIRYELVHGIDQYVIPFSKSYTNNLPPAKLVRQIDKIIEELQPDIIHVWGTESYWGFITLKHVNRFKVLLEIQGVLSQIKQQFFGGLTCKEILSCTGLKEILRPKAHLLNQYYLIKQSAQNELHMIKYHSFIGIQSEWSVHSIKEINSRAEFFNSLLPLREEFVLARQTWSHQVTGKIFTSAAGPISYKGLHVAIKSLKILIDSGVNASLNIAGAQSTGIRQSGYKRYLLSLIKDFNLEVHINWLGALDAKEIVRELQTSDIVLIPSYMESYCLFLYESLCVGIPIVCSYAGAMPEAGIFNPNIKYFQPGDYLVAASHLSDFLKNNYQNDLESYPIVTAEAAVKRQLEIYNKIFST